MKRRMKKILSLFKKEKNKEIIKIPLYLISSNPYQPRKDFEEKSLKELAQSIKEYGVVQPIIVRKTSLGFELVTGERRLRACKMLNLEKIPAIVENLSDEEMLEIAFLENLQREDLNTLEEAETYNRLRQEFKRLTLEELSNRIGKDKEEIEEKLSFLSLPLLIKKATAKGIITKEQAKILQSLTEEELQKEALQKIYDKKLTTTQTERLVRYLLNKESSDEVLDVAVQIVRNLVDAMEDVGIRVNFEEKKKDDGLQIKIYLFKE